MLTQCEKGVNVLIWSVKKKRGGKFYMAATDRKLPKMMS